MKIQTAKFIRNIVIGIIALIVVAFIINIAPGYRRNKYKNVINLVIGEENVTEQLKHPIYKDEKGELYISKDDIKNLLDKTIYYDETENMLITTSEVAVGSMVVGEKQIIINNSRNSTLSTIIYDNNIMYVPIKEMQAVYNIELQYIEESNILVIDSLNKGMIKAEATQETVIRYKQRSLSKEVGKLKQGDIVSAFYTTSKGWRQIRTEDGKVGFVKANTLTNEYIVRQDMSHKPNTKEVNANINDNSQIQIDGDSVLIKDLLKMTAEGILLKNVEIVDDENTKIWANLSIDSTNLNKFQDRNKTIKNIVSVCMKNNIKGVNIILTDKNDNIERFIIELAPRLREIGVKTNIVLNENFVNYNFETYNEIVDYIIKN